MTGDLQEIFTRALYYFFNRYKARGGTQDKLARKLGVSQSYISGVLIGRKKASAKLQERIAELLYGPYEEFLAVGRRLKDGLDPEFVPWRDKDDSVESLIKKLSYYIKDHQRIEKKLVEMKNFYEVIVEKMQSGVLVTDKSDKIFYINNWLLNKYGISRESLIGTFVPDMDKAFPLGRFKPILRHYIKAKESLESQEFTNLPVISPSGQEAYRSGWCIPLHDHREYRGMIVTVGDRTAEIQLRQKLQEETWLMQSAMESTDWLGWVILDRSNRIIKHNNIYKKMFNIPEEILRENNPRKNLDWIKSKVRDKNRFMQLSFQALKQEKKLTHEFELTDGRWIQRVSVPLYRDNELMGRNILLYDITAEKRAQS